MIICRKCQRHHPDSVGAGPCPCGANLKRDGIALVQTLDAMPPEPPPSDLDDLPPLGDPEPDTAAPPAAPGSPGFAPPPGTDAGADDAAAPAASRPSRAASRPTTDTGSDDAARDAPTDAAKASPPAPPSGAAKRLTSALKGRSRRRAGSATPKPAAKTDESGGAAGSDRTRLGPNVAPSPAEGSTAASPTDAQAAESARPSDAPAPGGAATAGPTAPTRPDEAPGRGGAVLGRAGPPTPGGAIEADIHAVPADPRSDAPRHAGPTVAGQELATDARSRAATGDPSAHTAAAGGPTASGTGGPTASGTDATDAPAKGGGRTLRGPRRRAGSVNPRDLIAAQQDADAPNVGVVTSQPAATGPAGTAATPPGLEVTEVDAVPTPRPPRAGERACPACHEPNPDTRRFCLACGLTMPAAAPGTTDGDGTGAEAATGGPGDGRQKGKAARTWRQKARAAGHNRMRYASGFSRAAKAKAIMALFGLAAVAAALVIGPGRERVLALVGRGSEGTSPATAELVDGEEVVGLPPADVRDDDKLTGVGISDDDRERARLVLTLDEPTRVRKLLIAPGLPDEAEEGPLFLRPSRVQVCSDGGSCQEIALDDSTSLQSQKVSLGDDVSRIELSILDVHEPEHTTYPLAVISEIRVVG